MDQLIGGDTNNKSSQQWRPSRRLPQVALDGMTPGRRAVLEYLIANPVEHSTAAVAGHCRLPETPIRRHLQDLTAHGAVDLTGQHPERWSASEWLRENWWAVSNDEWTESREGCERPASSSTRLNQARGDVVGRAA